MRQATAAASCWPCCSSVACSFRPLDAMMTCSTQKLEEPIARPSEQLRPRGLKCGVATCHAHPAFQVRNRAGAMRADRRCLRSHETKGQARFTAGPSGGRSKHLRTYLPPPLLLSRPPRLSPTVRAATDRSDRPAATAPPSDVGRRRTAQPAPARRPSSTAASALELALGAEVWHATSDGAAGWPTRTAR